MCWGFPAAGSVSGAVRQSGATEGGADVQQPMPADFDAASCSVSSAQQLAAAAEYAGSVAAGSTLGSTLAQKTAAAKKAPDPSRDPGMVPGVQTGEDVVAFYGRNGQDSSVKFFYCVR